MKGGLLLSDEIHFTCEVIRAMLWLYFNCAAVYIMWENDPDHWIFKNLRRFIIWAQIMIGKKSLEKF